MLSEFTNMRSDGSGSLEDEYRELVDEILKERFPDGFSFTKIIVEPSTNLDGEDTSTPTSYSRAN